MPSIQSLVHEMVHIRRQARDAGGGRSTIAAVLFAGP